jgi:mannose-6-phosphate isomerase-like protein (cupin superfamily)
MRRNILAALGAVLVVGLYATLTYGQAGQGGGRGAGAAAVPELPIGKTAFWANDDIQARWKENEALKRNNSRLFNGPTNISANVRIVVEPDPPGTHETTADLWIVTAGTATAETDGQIVGEGASSSIRNGTVRMVHPGDILYVPPGIPHHFTGMKGFRAWLIRFDTLGLVRTGPAPQAPQGRGAAPEGGRGAAAEAGGRGGAPAPPVPDVATDKTMFWTNDELQALWKGNEANKRNNSRLYNGPANITANVRIVLPNDPPATHEDTADLWLVTEGTAVARTDGKIVEANGTRSIQDGVQRAVHPGDLLYVPPEVPHHFTDMKGFRALLIRFDVVGWRQSQPAPQGGGRGQ